MAIRYRKFDLAEYIMQVRGGKTVREGAGLTLLYSTLRSSILSVPTTAQDTDFVFDDVLTADFQSCCVQGTVTCRFRRFRQAAEILDFAFCERAAVQEKKRSEVRITVASRQGRLVVWGLHSSDFVVESYYIDQQEGSPWNFPMTAWHPWRWICWSSPSTAGP